MGGPAVELIGLGSVGHDAKLHGVRCWHRAASFKHLEWFDVKTAKSTGTALWLGIDEGPRLAKIIDSFSDLAGMTHDPEKEFCENVHITVTEQEIKLFHEKSSSTFTLAARRYDADWAAGLIVIPSTSPPTCAIKIVSGMDQIAAVLKRIDKWKEAWSVDLLTISAIKSIKHNNNNNNNNNDDYADKNCLWNLIFTAESSSPPIVNLAATLPNCPESQASSSRSTNSNNYKSNENSQVSLGLSAALKALIGPLADSKALSGSISGITWFWVPQEALVCNVAWNAIGMGQVSSTIFLPCRIK